jgi:hypothetical protein
MDKREHDVDWSWYDQRNPPHYERPPHPNDTVLRCWLDCGDPSGQTVRGYCLYCGNVHQHKFPLAWAEAPGKLLGCIRGNPECVQNPEFKISPPDEYWVRLIDNPFKCLEEMDPDDERAREVLAKICLELLP